jgi:hypothetical protein
MSLLVHTVDNFNGPNRPQLAYDLPTEAVALVGHSLAPWMPTWAIVAGGDR